MAGGRIPVTRETLTARELEVLALIADGLSNPEIAEKLMIEKTTVRTHTIRIFQVLQVENRTQAAVYYVTRIRRN